VAGPVLESTSSTVDFDCVYHSYRQRVYALCLRMARNRADAEDLTQEAFFRLFRKMGTFRGDSAFTTWLHRLVVNVVLARLRRKSPAECPLDTDTFHGQRFLPQELLGGLDTTLISAIDRLTLELAVAELPLGFRTVFVLHDVEGYQHSEIARLLGVSEGTSKSQLHRARERLRHLLERGPARKTRAGNAGSHRTVIAGAGKGEATPGKVWNAREPSPLFRRRTHEQAAFSA
jgi:RNA polymerase sigma-70 factor, ECF subfamily